jgi:D-glycero-beta-D-manno-heptose 1-phosphate adenylyltransferase
MPANRSGAVRVIEFPSRRELAAGGRRVGEVLTRGELNGRVGALKRGGKRVVFTNGCFDILHPGHIRMLEKARSLGDALVVAINSDPSVQEMKGPQRPMIPGDERAELLAALESVDFVAVFGEPTPRELIAEILPDVLVKGSDWGPDEIVGREEVEAAGGEVVSIPLEPGYSTTKLIERIRHLPA